MTKIEKLRDIKRPHSNDVTERVYAEIWNKAVDAAISVLQEDEPKEAGFAKSLLSSFTEKDKEETKVYDEMKAIDLGKEVKPVDVKEQILSMLASYGADIINKGVGGRSTHKGYARDWYKKFIEEQNQTK